MRGFRRGREEAFEALTDAAMQAMSHDDMIACAMRRDRLRTGDSQRAYAVRRGFSSAFVARLESRPADLSLGAVLSGLESTAYAMAVVPTGVRTCISTELVSPDAREVATAAREIISASGMSLRRFAESTGLSRTMMSRSQNAPAGLKLSTARAVLGAGSRSLLIATREGGLVQQPADWDVGEITARARGGRRRLAGHRLPLHTPDGPMWWWYTTEFYASGAEVPQWTTLKPDHTRDIPAYRHAPWWIRSA